MSAPPGWSRDTYFKGGDSGGALFDLHVHDTDFVQFLFGRPTRVFLHRREPVQRRHRSRRHPVHGAGGATVYAEGSWLLASGFSMSYTVMFESATADYDSARGDEALRARGRQGSRPAWSHRKAPMATSGNWSTSRAIRSGQPPTVVTAQDGLSAVEICEAEEKSVQTGQPVRV